MELSELGLNSWLADQASALRPPGESLARVTAVDRDRYLIHNERGEMPAELKGRLVYVSESRSELPCVGDWVCVSYHDQGSHAIIHRTLPRASFLRRKAPGRNVEFQMIAANIDVALIVQSCHFDFNVARLERYLVVVGEGGIEPCQRRLDGALHRRLAGLRLPARERAARVFDQQRKAGHGAVSARPSVRPGRPSPRPGAGAGRPASARRAGARSAAVRPAPARLHGPVGRAAR